MRARLVVGLLLALLALLGGPAALAAGPYPPPSSGSGQVDPSRIRHGECATFTGDGFTPGEPITITDNGTPIGTVVADSQGRFSYRYCPTSSARPGRHVLGARGSVSGMYVTAVVIITGVKQSASQPAAAQGTNGGGAGAGVGRGLLAFTGLPALVIAVAGTVLVLLGSLLLLLADRRYSRRRRSELAA
ncbi:MAG TPA: hypothetical protein VM097_03900 [Mycobacteriales bacterium]|nr:hypothetical protein [Mycobacteriales bacterium]